MCRIGGRLRSGTLVLAESQCEIPPFVRPGSNFAGRTPLGGEVDWGGRLQKRNGGFPRSAQREWQPREECSGKSGLDWETNKTSRYESRAKCSGGSSWEGHRSED